MIAITDRQSEVLTFIRAFITEHRVSPTIREIGTRFTITPRAVFDHLNALERKGYIDRFQGMAGAERAARSIRLTEPSR